MCPGEGKTLGRQQHGVRCSQWLVTGVRPRGMAGLMAGGLVCLRRSLALSLLQ